MALLYLTLSKLSLTISKKIISLINLLIKSYKYTFIITTKVV
jgi:hypothetical protein